MRSDFQGQPQLDVVAFETEDSHVEAIAGEVKKSVRDIDALVAHVYDFAVRGCTEEPSDSAAKNAYRKWVGLRDRNIPIFWVVGPDSYEFAFEMKYLDSGRATMTEIPVDRLRRDKV